MSLTIPQVIQKKKEGQNLSSDEIHFFVKSVVDGTAQQSQIGAMLMAIYLQGLNEPETIELTRAMTFSGDTLQFPPEWKDVLIDKHSTGGVGDKISLILAPALAALGFKVPMVSGRGLGFTGGTLDKLESIPGFKTLLNEEEMTDILDSVGCFIAGATGKLAPADAVLYKLRDVTSTVDSIPLIVSSILSKKVAEGTKALVMDVKVGKGAFLKTEEFARKLARLLVNISKGLEVETRAVLSRMDAPLGCAIGNSLEVIESVHVLQGGGPQDIQEQVEVLGGVLLQIKGRVKSLEEGQLAVRNVLKNGKALKKFEQMMIKQGASSKVAKEISNGDFTSLRKAPYTTDITAPRNGYVEDIDALEIGIASWKLGAGRSKSGDPIDHSVGILLSKKLGDSVETGEVLVQVHHATEELSLEIRSQIESAITISDSFRPINPIIDIIS